jgi:cysteine-rich repeat protein
MMLATLLLGGWFSVIHAQPMPGDVLIADQQFGNATTGFRGGLFVVKPTGARSLLSDFNNAAQGPLGGGGAVGVSGVVVETAGTILVTDRNAGTGSRGLVFRVAANGTRTVLTDFGNATQGPIAAQPTGIGLEANGNVVVATRQISGALLGVLFRVNSATGNRTILSDFNIMTQGPPVAAASGVVVEATGAILVVDPNTGTNGRGALVRVDPTTGARTMVSNFGNMTQGPLGTDPTGVAVDPAGGILVIDQRGGLVNQNIGTLFRVDPVTGVRTLLSDFSDSLKGPLGKTPTGVTVDLNGNILVVDLAASVNNFSGSLFRVNPLTGTRVLLNDFGQGAPQGQTPSGLVAFSACGDGTLVASEECDDGNRLNGDGCSDQCKVEPGFAACMGRIATIIGTPGDDVLVGTRRGDVIAGLGGNDTIFGNAGRDVICGGEGNDVISGGSTNDVIDGGSGNDFIDGGSGKDDIKGGDGDDNMIGGGNKDTCDGGPHVVGDTAAPSCDTVFNVP